MAILEREELLDEYKMLEYHALVWTRDSPDTAGISPAVNGRSVSVSLLRELGEYLVDLHGQSEHLSLLRVNQHLGLLDRYATTDPRVGAGALH